MEPLLGTSVLLLVLVAGVAMWTGDAVLRGRRLLQLRQKWIHDQTADLALVVSRAGVLVELAGHGPDLNGFRAKALHEFEAATFRIKLREPWDTTEWSDVIAGIDSLREIVHEPSRAGPSVSSLTTGIISAAAPLLRPV